MASSNGPQSTPKNADFEYLSSRASLIHLLGRNILGGPGQKERVILESHPLKTNVCPFIAIRSHFSQIRVAPTFQLKKYVIDAI